MIQDDSLNVPPPVEPPTDDPIAKEFEPIDSGSELEEDGTFFSSAFDSILDSTWISLIDSFSSWY